MIGGQVPAWVDGKTVFTINNNLDEYRIYVNDKQEIKDFLIMFLKIINKVIKINNLCI